MRLAGDPERPDRRAAPPARGDAADEPRGRKTVASRRHARRAQRGRTRRSPSRRAVADYKIELVGHGVGLDIHDVPDYYYDDRPLRANEVITIEPCLLKPGVGGTRIEDVVVVKKDGCEVLTDTPRGLFPGGDE